MVAPLRRRTLPTLERPPNPSDSPEPDDWTQSPYVQTIGAFWGGIGLGIVPFAGTGHQVLTDGHVLGRGSPEALRGLAVGQIVGGIFSMVGGVTGEILGGLATTTGIGAALGVPAIVVATPLVLGGAANIWAGLQGLTQSMMSSGSGSQAAPGVKRPPNPHGSRGGPAHRAKVESRVEELRARGHEHLGGGSLPEEQIPTPGGSKTFRRPDITTRAPDGSIYRENVGRSTSGGRPVAREQRALDDIEAAAGQRPGYTSYDQ